MCTENDSGRQTLMTAQKIVTFDSFRGVYRLLIHRYNTLPISCILHGMIRRFSPVTCAPEQYMAYSRSMTVEQPGCLIFLLDRSGSMNDPFPHEQLDGRVRSKAYWLAHVLNEFIYELVLENTGGERVRNRLDLAVIGYGNATVASALPQRPGSPGFVSLQQLSDGPLRVEQSVQRVVDEDGSLFEIEQLRKIWIEPVAAGNTPMVAALRSAYDLAADWVQRNPQAYPPIVLNITDGMSSDGDPVPQADRLRELATADGHLLLYNCHITDQQTDPVRWPHRADQLVPKKSALTLFTMSSPLPERACDQMARISGERLTPGARGYVYNGNPAALKNMLEFGTVATRLIADPLR